jgi:hypothetical protein
MDWQSGNNVILTNRKSIQSNSTLITFAITTVNYVTIHSAYQLIIFMEHGSPSEIDNYSVNEKSSPQCMKTENSLPYYLVYQDMLVTPTLSTVNSVHASTNFLSGSL